MDDETLKLLGYVISSTYRTEVMKSLIDGQNSLQKLLQTVELSRTTLAMC